MDVIRKRKAKTFVTRWHNKSFLLIIAYTLIFFLLSACSDKELQKKYVIGFSQCTLADNWRKTMVQGMERELSFHPEIKFILKDANANTQKQVEQIQGLINQGIDLLIVSPNEAAPITPVVEEAYKKGIKVIIVDRRTTSPAYTAYVGASNYDVGVNAGTYANSLLKGKGNIIEIGERPGSSPDIDRHNGFMDIVKQYPGLNYVKKFVGDWDKFPIEDKLTEFLTSHKGDIQLIFSQNDRFALKAYNVCKKLGLDKQINIIGVDGLPGKNGGIDLVDKGWIKATILYPTGGEEAIITAEKILQNQPYEKENSLATSIIDSTNVRITKLQTEKLLSQQQDIDRRQQKIEQQEIITRNKTTVIYIVSISLAVALILGAILFYYLKENRKISAKLALKNEEIINHQQQLIELSEKAKKANEAKVNFFTNISHEFRTPLTLILGPLEELLTDKKIQYATRQSLTMIQKNVIRLLRLFNQLMDFRKIEADKMRLRASEDDLISFVAEIVQAYKSISTKRNIDLRFITEERQLNVWFDASMLDKVIFNLLSNAFKFTKDNGYIHVYIHKNETEGYAVIKVEDNGIGMSEDAVAHAFDIFYQGEYENYKGSGLGLALSKELIQLHKGCISVRSEKWKGTAFEIYLPLGSEHLEKEEMTASEPESPVLYEHEKIYVSDLEIDNPIKNEIEGIAKEKEFSILIIEDNTDLRYFLHNKLNSHYEVLEADNGQSALQQAFDNIPDLIICDVVIPGKDGMALTNIFKSDIRTSHIPIILLTAKTSTDQQIEGMKNKADVYITKPFNLKFLEETIKSLIANRAKLKEHYTGELPLNLKSQTINKLDKKFISEFTALVESNIANDDFSVDDICKSMGISRVQLYRKVKALLDVNVNDYILNTRLQKAKYLLQHEELTIGEIAYKVGFSTPAYFSTVFKSKFGLTPKAFKEQ